MNSVLQLAPILSSSADPRMPARPTSTSASDHTLARSLASPARAASSKRVVAADAPRASRSKLGLLHFACRRPGNKLCVTLVVSVSVCVCRTKEEKVHPHN